MNKKDYIKEFISKLSNLDRSRSISTVFNDFLTLSCCSLAQTVYRSDNLEQRYLNIIKTYTKEQAEEFSKLLAFLVLGLEQEPQLITLSEPCCGSGALIIAFAQTLKEQNINYQQNLFVEAIDISEMCFKITYIQLSLLGIPAKVIQGDSLSLKFQQVLYTPFYFVNGFVWKLKKQNKVVNNELAKNVINKQLSLFNC